MVLIAFLLVAVASLVLGLVLASTIWLVVSLVASGLAAVALYLVVRTQRAQKSPEPVAAPAPAPATTNAAVRAPALVPAGGPAGHSGEPTEPVVPSGLGVPTAVPPTGVWVVDGRPDYHVESCAKIADSPAEVIPLAQAVDDGFTACRSCGPPTPSPGAAPSPALRVWVADGYPEYHVGECTELAGLQPEPVPYEQAVEDGFQPCVVCDPDAAFAGRPRSAFAAAAAVAGDQVWVADGHPRYHVESCAELATLHKEPVARAQAVEDGFAPCPTCLPGAAPETSGAAPSTVWVADGYPDYHLAGCELVQRLSGEPVPYAQAVEDGFAPCALCSPPTPVVPPGTAQVWVIDGRPEFHRRDCADIIGEGPEPISYAQAMEDGFAPCAHCTPDKDEPAAPAGDGVWVVDGHPDYHLPDCAAIAGLDSVPISHSQADEDGFTPCGECEPNASRAQLLPGTAIAESAAEPHAAEFEMVAEPQAVAEPEFVEPEFVEPAPVAESESEPEAVVEPETVTEPEPAMAAPAPVDTPEDTPQEDTPQVDTPQLDIVAEPQVLAEPELAATPEPPAAAAAVTDSDPGRQVWVRNGRPRYHAEGCLIIKGQEAVAISRAQAEADGFQPCSLCAES